LDVAATGVGVAADDGASATLALADARVFTWVGALDADAAQAALLVCISRVRQRTKRISTGSTKR
jgi:hypothetical protein